MLSLSALKLMALTAMAPGAELFLPPLSEETSTCGPSLPPVPTLTTEAAEADVAVTSATRNLK